MKIKKQHYFIAVIIAIYAAFLLFSKSYYSTRIWCADEEVGGERRCFGSRETCEEWAPVTTCSKRERAYCYKLSRHDWKDSCWQNFSGVKCPGFFPPYSKTEYDEPCFSSFDECNKSNERAQGDVETFSKFDRPSVFTRCAPTTELR